MEVKTLIQVALGMVFLIFAVTQAEMEPKKSQAVMEVEEDEDDDDDDIESWDLNHEVFGPHPQRLEGFHILDRDLNIVLSEPSERLMRAIVEPPEGKKRISLEQVKEIHRKHVEQQKAKTMEKNMGYSNKEFEKMLAEEQKTVVKEAKEETVLDRVMDFFW